MILDILVADWMWGVGRVVGLVGGPCDARGGQRVGLLVGCSLVFGCLFDSRYI